MRRRIRYRALHWLLERTYVGRLVLHAEWRDGYRTGWKMRGVADDVARGLDV